MSSRVPERRVIIRTRTTIVIVIILVTAGVPAMTVAALLFMISAVAVELADQTTRPARH